MKPELSAIAITPGSYEIIRAVVRAVGRQDIADRMELVIVGPEREKMGVIEGDLAPFAKVTFVTLEGFQETPVARALGIHAASADVVVILEEHCFPAQGWGRALLERHREDWTGVAPLVLNGNPSSAVSWANYLTEYGQWMRCRTAHPLECIPGHNSSYKRAALLEYGDDLPLHFASESALQLDMGSRGHRFCIDRGARTFHLNPSLLIPSMKLTFWGGRLFAANRVRPWSTAKRLLYGFGSPLVPFVRFAKIWPIWKAAKRKRPGTVDMFLTLSMMLIANGLGEMMGCFFGEGDSVRRTSTMEFRRRSYMGSRDKLSPEVQEALQVVSP